MIKYVRMEKDNDFEQTGVKILDLAPNSVTLQVGDKTPFRIDVQYSDIRVMLPAKPKMVKKYTVSGTYEGLEFCDYFESKFDAEQKINSFCFEIRENFKVKEIEVAEA